MKDHSKIWGRFLQRSYSSVNTNINGPCPDECNVSPGRKVAKRILNTKCPSHFSIGLLGMFGIVVGFLIYIINPYDAIFKFKILFNEGGEIFEMWRSPPVDLYLRVFLFNVTNKDEFLSGIDKKIKVQEVGPYVYREMMSHDNVVFNDNGTVSTNPSHPLVWVPEMSVGDPEKDILTLPHIALLSIADVVSDSSYFTKIGLNLVIRQTKTHPLVQMTPKEFMFGYTSTLMTLGNKFLPGWISFDKLGLIDRMYNFKGDYETVYTGRDDITKAGLLATYNGSPQMPQWKDQCGVVSDSSDGTKFKSHLKPNETLTFFRKSMCRPQTLMHVNNTVSSGLRGYVYKFKKNAMDNGVNDADNKCFCRTKTCLPSGLLDVRQCYYGFPIALSYPHFLNCDPILSTYSEGSVPDPQKHDTYFVINPESGLPLDLAVRFQINMALGKIKSIAHCEKFENIVLPLLWTEIRMYSLPSNLATRFKLYLNILPVVVTSTMYGLTVLGILFLAVALYKQFKHNCINANNPSSNNGKFAKIRRRTRHIVTWLDNDDDDHLDQNCQNNNELNPTTKYEEYKPTKRASMTNKELEVYFNSLVAPLNQDLEEDDLEEINRYTNISFREFQDMKEVDILE